MKTIGKKINELRKMRNMTQDELADQMGVSSQAVSKWENDLSIPDVPILLELADFFHISLDELVREQEASVAYVPQEKRKRIEDMFLRVIVDTSKKDKVRVNLPLALVKMANDAGIDIADLYDSPYTKKLDLRLIMQMIESGVIGKIVEVDTGDGDHVEVFVE